MASRVNYRSKNSEGVVSFKRIGPERCAPTPRTTGERVQLSFALHEVGACLATTANPYSRRIAKYLLATSSSESPDDRSYDRAKRVASSCGSDASVRMTLIQTLDQFDDT